MPEVSCSFSLSLVLHGLLTLAVVYAPQWLHSKPFTVPVSYEVTLITPRETGSWPKSAPPPKVRQKKVATATAKAARPPRGVLTLPSLPKPSVQGAATRSLAPPTRVEELTLPARRRSSKRHPVTPPVAPPTPPKIVAPLVTSMPVISQPAFALPAEGLAKVGTDHEFGAATETGVTVGNADPALAYYFVLIQDKITSYWTPPKIRPGTTASASLSLRILRSGQVRDLAIGSSSEDRLFDDLAVRAVSLASPLPPLPPLFKAEALSLELRFTFVGEMS